MGVVYRAYDPKLMREVAIKVIRAEGPGILDSDQLRRRIELEAKAAGMLQHPGIVAIHDAGEYGGQIYLVMELIEGKTLDQLLEARALPIPKTLAILRQVAAALDYAHSRKIVHRDIKPGNIIVQSDGTAKILDFGIAKSELLAGPGTGLGLVFGSTHYLSPEQLLGQAATAFSDQWSLAVTAFEALTGRQPFAGDNQATLTYQICHAPHADPRSPDGPMPDTVVACFAKALNKQPEARFTDCSAFVAELSSGFENATTVRWPAPEMSRERHNLARAVFEGARELPAFQRAAFVASACGGDREVQQEAESLLEASGEAQKFLEHETGLEQETRRSVRIGRYVVIRELGRGGMGVVYEAADPQLGRRVAIKTIHPQASTNPAEAAELRDRFLREARSAAALSHAGIVSVYDSGEDGGVAYIAMELVEGPPLDDYLKSGGRPQLAQSADIVRQAAAALDYAHQKGVIHRDIKPPNLLLHHQTQVKIADFGLARIMFAPKYTVTGVVMGTPEYMSPEHIDAHEVTGKSDQFSLAVIAYQLLTGAMPFQGGSAASIMHKIVAGPRPSARAVNPALPAAVDEVLKRGMAQLPEQRYATCTEFADALESALRLGQKSPVRLVPGHLRSYMVVVSLLVLVALAAGAMYHYRGSREAPIVATARPPANAAAVPPVPSGSQVGDSAQTTPKPVAADSPSIEKAPPSPDTEPSGSNPVKPDAARGSQNPPTAVGPAPQTGVVVPPVKTGVARGSQNSSPAVGATPQTGVVVPPVKTGVARGNQNPPLTAGPVPQSGTPVSPAPATNTVADLQKAAGAGDAAAMEKLGQLYERSNNTPQSAAQAFYWYKKAAGAGRVSSMYRLGLLYETGRGTVRNVNEAIRLYQRAAAAGSAEASQRLEGLPTAATRPAPTPVEPREPPANPGAITVRVAATAPWTDTGINLHSGDTVTVTGFGLIAVTADGLVPPKAPGGFAPNCGAATTFYHHPFGLLPAPNLPCWSLIGRVGNGNAFEVGVRRVFRVPSGGRLYLGVNDDSFGDNSGFWTAAVLLQSGR